MYPNISVNYGMETLLFRTQKLHICSNLIFYNNGEVVNYRGIICYAEANSSSAFKPSSGIYQADDSDRTSRLN